MVTGNLTMFPCAHCGSTTTERTNWGGLTGSYWICVDGVACQARRVEIERRRVAEELEQENIDNVQESS